MVWRVEPECVVIVPITGMNGSARHRAEIPIDDVAEIVRTGISIKQPCVRCHAIRRIARELLHHTPTGTASQGLMDRIARALDAEWRALEFERRASFGRAA